MHLNSQMRIHKVLIKHTVGHLVVSALLFLWINYYTSNKEPGLFYFLGYFGCLCLFTFIGPLFLSEKTNYEIRNDPFFGGSILILVLNIFTPFIGGLIASEIFENFFNN